MDDVFIGLGSNLGNKLENLSKALELISEVDQTFVEKKSGLYRTSPVGEIEQDFFINQVVQVRTEIKPRELFEKLKNIEILLGRKETFKWGPRIIDLDILFFGEKLVDSIDLIIPHQLLHERLFVLIPFVDISPNFVHPLLKKSIKTLLSELKIRIGDTQVVESYKENG